MVGSMLCCCDRDGGYSMCELTVVGQAFLCCVVVTELEGTACVS